MEEEIITYQDIVHAMATWHLIEVLKDTEEDIKHLELIRNKLVVEDIVYVVFGVKYSIQTLGVLTQEEFDEKVELMKENLNDYITKYSIQTLDPEPIRPNGFFVKNQHKRPDLINNLMYSMLPDMLSGLFHIYDNGRSF